jgi:hypothetical protein
VEPTMPSRVRKPIVSRIMLELITNRLEMGILG